MTTPRTVDLRSDTVTRPTRAMREAMLSAEVGDVVFSDDPTVHRLERTIADRLGFEAALFVPSGTMSNQIAVGAIGGPGDALLVPHLCHISRWEGAGAAASFGVHLIQVRDDVDTGLPSVDRLAQHAYAPHVKAPRVVGLTLENTHNIAGGRVFSPADLEPRLTWAASRGLHRHLDGARVFNAAVALGVDVKDITRGFSSVSVCFSKGLGAPVGSAICGDAAFIARADRHRHRFGGAWRQAGILAAAALHALEHHVDRLADDHRRARLLAERMVACRIAEPLHPVETNIVQFRVHPRFPSSAALAETLAAHHIRFLPTGPQTGRFVTHLDVDDADLARVAAVWETL
jgi:threonine aldolase